MQFTGLHDKNGKEIYEGDILPTRANGNHPVVFDWGGFKLDGWAIGAMHVDERAVLGNIYENPELLSI
jgi:hypothetical protein